MLPEFKFGPLVYWCFDHPRACGVCLWVRGKYHHMLGINSTFQKKSYLRTWLPSLSRQRRPLDGWFYHEGLTGGELKALAIEGAFTKGETQMDEKWLGVVRHVLTTVGAVMTTMGVMDEATWVTVSGAILTLVPFIWSWMSKPAEMV